MSSSPIASFIRSGEHASKEDAFQAFLDTPRIRAWAGEDKDRVHRLRQEFDRVWAELKDPGDAKPAAAKPAATGGGTVPVRRVTGLPQGRTVMCPKCRSLDLRAHLKGDVMGIRCRQCDEEYADLLELIPVRPVGPFAYLLGDGWQGVTNAAGILVLLILLYGVLKWLL